MRYAFAVSLWFLRITGRLFKAALSVKLPSLPTYFVLAQETIQRHVAIYGLSGAGKSRLLISLVIRTIEQMLRRIIQHGVIVFDVHGSLYTYFKAWLALLALQHPELYEIIVLIDVTNPEWTVRYDPLVCTKNELPSDRAEALTDAISTVYQDDPAVTVHLRRVLYHAFLTLILAGLPLRDLPRLFRDKEFRAGILYALNSSALNEFWAWFPSADKITAELRQFVDSTLNRVEVLYNNPRIADFLGRPATINWQDILERGAIVLINADKGVLSEGGAYLFCALLMAEVLRAAFLRAVDTPETRRRPVMLVADEYASYTTETIIKIITEARKYKVEGVFASQEVIGQGKNEPLQRKILKLVGALASFRIGGEDARILLDDLMSLQLDQVKYTRKVSRRTFGIGAQSEEAVFRGLDEIRQIALQNLIDLQDRLFYLKERGKPGTRLLETPFVPDLEDLPNAHLIPEALERLDREVFNRFGVPRERPLGAVYPPPNIRRDFSVTPDTNRDENYYPPTEDID